MIKRRLGIVLGGIGLSTAFFLPIAAAAQVDAPLLMWAPRHTIELLCAWSAISMCAAVALEWSDHGLAPRREAIFLALLAVPSALSLLAVVGRSAPEATSGVRSIQTIVLIVSGALAILVTLLWRAPEWLTMALRSIFMFGVVLLGPATVAIAGLLPDAAAYPGKAIAAVEGDAEHCNDVFVLLFDELSYDAVFSGGQATLDSLAQLTTSARLYHHAVSEAVHTHASIASYLSAPLDRSGSRDTIAAGPLGLAHDLGLHTDVNGWFFPYCEVLGAYAERCHSYSMYNAATLFESFAPWAPIETVLNIWPYQLPTGLGKRPAAVHLQSAELAALIRQAVRPPEARPMLRWIHFNVPHVPWLRDTGLLRYRAFLSTRDRYFKQVAEVDLALGAVLASLRARGDLEHTTIVVTSDHGSRGGHAGSDYRHVPLVVYSAATARQDLDEPVHVSDILKRVVADACHAA